MIMIYLLFDNPGDSGRVSFISRLSSMEMREVFSPRRKRLILGWCKGARDEDTLRDLLQITPPYIRTVYSTGRCCRVSIKRHYLSNSI